MHEAQHATQILQFKVSIEVRAARFKP